MSIHVKEVAYIFHPVSDIARAREFYEKLLGLKKGLEVEFQPGKWWVEYDIAGVALAISNALGTVAPGGAGFALEVESLDETLAAIKAAGLPLVLEPQDFPPCRMFIVNSPDGHAVTFHERKKG
jgi:catechol 2,3-dioxygenase-like lactoylglutathione lyase family enzyme